MEHINHATNEGICSWAGLAKEVFIKAGYLTQVNFISTSEYSTRIFRSLNSRLNKQSLDEAGFSRLPNWQDAVLRCMKEK